MKTLFKGFCAFFAVLTVLLSGCASVPSAYRDISMVEVTENTAGNKTEEGKIVFTEEQGLLASLFGKKTETMEVSSGDISITGKRTSSEEPKKTSSNSKIIKILDAIVRDDSWTYDWKGSVETDGVTIPVNMTMRVSEDFSKIYRLNSAVSHSHQKAKGFTGNLRKFFGADVSVRLTVKEPVDNTARTVPFEIGRFSLADGSEYRIQVMRTLDSSAQGAKPTARSLLFSRFQRYEITDSSGEAVYADCTVDGFSIYESDFTSSSDNRLLLKECIGLFTAWLWSLDEHEKSSSMLN